MKRLIVGISGASGVIYGIRMLRSSSVCMANYQSRGN